MTRTIFAVMFFAIVFTVGIAAHFGRPQAPCKPPEAIHLMLDADGSYLIPDHIALARDGVDRKCKP